MNIDKDWCSYEEPHLDYSSGEKLPNVKFTPPVPSELKVDVGNNLEPFGYILLKPEYKENVKSILGEMRFNNTIRYDIFYLLSPSDIELLKKDNKLNEYFIPCLSYNDEKLILGNTKEFEFKKITSDGYFEALINNEDKIKIKLPEGKWYMFYNSELHDENRLIFYKEKTEEIKPYGYSKDESYEHLFNKKDEGIDIIESDIITGYDKKVYGYMLIKPEYLQKVFLIIGNENLNTFVNDGIHIRQPENIKKLLDAGVLNEWFVPIFKYDEEELTFGFPDGFTNIHITTDRYLIADTNNTSDWRQLKFKLPKPKVKGKWVSFKRSIHGGNVTLNSLVEKGEEELIQGMDKTIIDGSKLRPYNRINVLSSQEGKMSMDDLEEELTKIVFKYASSHMMKKDLELSIKIMGDVIRHPQFYLNI